MGVKKKESEFNTVLSTGILNCPTCLNDVSLNLGCPVCGTQTRGFLFSLDDFVEIATFLHAKPSNNIKIHYFGNGYIWEMDGTIPKAAAVKPVAVKDSGPLDPILKEPISLDSVPKVAERVAPKKKVASKKMLKL